MTSLRIHTSYFKALFISQLAFFLIAMPAKADLVSLVEKSRDLKLAESDAWRRLVYYKRNFVGGTVSLSKGKGFFLAVNGATDPRAELEETLRGFFSSTKRDLPTQEPISLSVMCQFPARFEFLNRTLDLSKENLPIRPKDCADYQAFRARLNLDSISLVFSSHYVDNPSSIYGHTLLRLQKKRNANQEHRAESEQLLDNGVNFSADPNTTNPFLYAARGLAGGFDGHFAVLPYYYKVREYSDYESRDLWDYKLALSADELERLQAHLWELGTTHFDYYYLTENCSYYMLALLEVAAPRLNLITSLPFWIIPGDTLKAIARAGLVSEIQFRPSLLTQFEARKARLSKHQLEDLKHVLRNPLVEAPKNRDANVLDTAIDLFDLKHLSELMNREREASDQKQALLIARSKLRASPALGDLRGTKVSPHLSHPSSRLRLGRAEDLRFGGASEFQFRFAYHDLLDPEAGLPATSEVQFLDLKLRYWEQRRAFEIEDFTVFGITQLNPVREFFSRPSWQLRLLAKRFDDPRCENCTGAALEGGYGLTFQVADSNLFYILGTSALESAPRFEGSKFQPRVGGLLGTRLRFTDGLAAQVELKSTRNFFSEVFTENSLISRVRWAPLDWKFGLEAAAIWTTERQEVQTSALFYF